jgi:hypothetical protein
MWVLSLAAHGRRGRHPMHSLLRAGHHLTAEDHIICPRYRRLATFKIRVVILF